MPLELREGVKYVIDFVATEPENVEKPRFKIGTKESPSFRVPLKRWLRITHVFCVGLQPPGGVSKLENESTKPFCEGEVSLPSRLVLEVGWLRACNLLSSEIFHVTAAKLLPGHKVVHKAGPDGL
jgi:hypothetical protein